MKFVIEITVNISDEFGDKSYLKRIAFFESMFALDVMDEDKEEFGKSIDGGDVSIKISTID